MQAGFDDVVDTLVDEIVSFAPQVVVTYDNAGTYGHPDHKLVHASTVAAMPRVQTRMAGGALPAPVKVYESITERSARKAAGLGAHATQVTVAPSGTEYALSNNILQPILDREHFVLTSAADGLRPEPGRRETDLFAGIV